MRTQARGHGVDVDGLVEADITAAIDASSLEAAAGLEAAGCIDNARRSAEEFVASGRPHLEALPDSDARRGLGAIAKYSIEREYNLSPTSIGRLEAPPRSSR